MTTWRILVAVLLWTSVASGAEPPGAEAERDYSFAEVIQLTTGRRVVPFDPNDAAHAKLREQLLVAGRIAVTNARLAKISATRANEVGNSMEEQVLPALEAAGLKAHRPRTAEGRGRAAGYPDIEIESLPACYLELKTFNARSISSTQRTFYYSPSEETKVTRDALHLLLAFEIRSRDEGGITVWEPIAFKLVSLHDLHVRLKVEYNQSNRGLYSPGRVLAEERLDRSPD